MLLAGVVLGLIIGGGAVATAFGTVTRQRYASPHLHSGNWEGPTIEGHGRQARAVWRGTGGQTICVGSNHGPHICEIGPGTAHVDTCECSAKRYGVYGAWS